MLLNICRCSVPLFIGIGVTMATTVGRRFDRPAAMRLIPDHTKKSSPFLQVRSLQFARVISPDKNSQAPHAASFAAGGCPLSRSAWLGYERYWALDSCENCTISFENTRSRVQSMATRSFFSNRGNLLRYTVRQIHQARKPENLSPRMLATPVRFPMVASCPMVEKTKGFLGFPQIDAVMFWASLFACRRAC
jgi:hypothetical protein